MPYRFVEHVGEIEVGLEAASEAGIFEAGLADMPWSRDRW